MMIARRLLMFVLLLALLAACGTPPVNIESTTLNLNLRPGQRFRIKSATEQSFSGMFSMVKVDYALITINAYEVLDRTEDRYTLRVTYEHIEFMMNTNGEEVRVSSADGDTSSKFGACVCALAGMSLTMIIGTDGTIYEIEGHDDAIDRFAENLDLDVSEYEREQVRGHLDELASTLYANDRFQPFIPEEAVALNDTWEVSEDAALAIPAVLTTTYTLKELTDDEATLVASGDLEIEGVSEEDIAVYHYDLSGDQEGTVIVDRATGLARSSEIHQTLKGTMTVGSGDDEQDMRVTFDIDITTEQLDPDAPLPTPRPSPTPGPDAVSDLDDLWDEEDEEGEEEPYPTPLPPPPPPSDIEALALIRKQSEEPLPLDARISQRMDFDDTILLLIVAGPHDQTRLLGLATLDGYDGEWTTWGVADPDLLGLPGEPLIVADGFASTSDLEGENYTYHTVIYGQQPNPAVSSVEVRFSSGVPREASITSPDRTFMVISEYVDETFARACSITSSDSSGVVVAEQLLEPRWEAYAAEECGLSPQARHPDPRLSDAELLELAAETLRNDDYEDLLPKDLQLALLGRVDVPGDAEAYTSPFSVLLLGDAQDEDWMGYATYEVRRGQPLVYEAYALELERSSTLSYAIGYASTYNETYADLALGRSLNPLVSSVEALYAEEEPRRAEVQADGSWLIVGGDDTTCWLQSYDVSGAMIERVQVYDEEYPWHVEACTGQPAATPEITPTPGR